MVTFSFLLGNKSTHCECKKLMGFGLRSELSMFNWSIELLTLLLQYVIMQKKNTWPNLRNILISKYEPRMSIVYQVDLQPLRKNIIMYRKRSMDKFLLILPFMFLFHLCLAQHKDTPLRLLALIWTSALLIGSRKSSTKVPCRCIPLHAPISIAQTSFYASSTLSINCL